jgi:hypothetical protein
VSVTRYSVRNSDGRFIALYSASFGWYSPGLARSWPLEEARRWLQENREAGAVAITARPIFDGAAGCYRYEDVES